MLACALIRRLRAKKAKAMSRETAKKKVVIVGASGYTGAELVRLLLGHPNVDIAAVTADRKAGQAIGSVHPQLAYAGLPDLIPLESVDWRDKDVAFFCLPHGAAQSAIAGLAEHLKIIDLSADFRLDDAKAYAHWYGRPHLAPDLQKDAVYGLCEIARDAVRTARLVACPGCYPTSAQLPLAPLLKAGLIADQGIIIDSKSGLSGAGRTPKEGSLHCESSEGVHAYGVASHRHTPEIEQELSRAAGRPISVTFTPHLIPMNRGILSTIYANLAGGASAGDLREALAGQYKNDPFVHVMPQGGLPATRHVRGSNMCLIGVFADRVHGRVILISAIDNLVKGASGQAVQNMNLMCGFSETAALEQTPLFP